MGFFDHVFDNDHKQRRDIEGLKAQARSRLRSAGAAADRVAELEAEVGELALYCRSLMAVLADAGVVTQEKLLAAMERIDLEDGVRDGQATPERRRKPRAPAKRPRPRFDE